MSERTIASQVAAILARTGIGKQIADENEANRAAQHADLRKRKAAALALFQKQKPAADAALAAADAKAADAKKLADQALNDYIDARTKLETVYGTLAVTVDPIDAQMRSCCDPAIDVFKAQLEVLRSECTSTPQVIAINGARDAAERLKIDHAVDDVPAALADIRKSILEA